MAAHDAGLRVACPSCGETVLQKAMIPLVGEGGQGVRYACITCARAFIPATGPAESAAEGADGADVVADGANAAAGGAKPALAQP